MICRIRMLFLFILIFLSCSGIALGQSSKKVAIAGQVTDLFGQPIANAEIEIIATHASHKLYATSDSAGKYKIDMVPSGNYNIMASCKGFKKELKAVQLGSSESINVDFGLEVGLLHELSFFQINGVVSSKDGLILQGANVTAVCVFNSRLIIKATTNNRGQYTLYVANPGIYAVYVTKPIYKTKVVTVDLPASLSRDSRNIDFYLEMAP